MPKVIDVIYENLLKNWPTTRVKMKIEGILTTDFLKELDRRIKGLPKTRIDFKL